MEQKIFKAWQLLKGTSFGRWLFSISLYFFVPYSATIGARILEIEKGSSTVLLKDRRKIRNHLNSIHAVALANVAELASGLAMVSALSANTRGIVKNINIDYFKKARGQLTVKGHANPPQNITENIEHIVTAEIFDSSKEVVASMKVTWQIGPNAK